MKGRAFKMRSGRLLAELAAAAVACLCALPPALGQEAAPPVQPAKTPEVTPAVQEAWKGIGRWVVRLPPLGDKSYACEMSFDFCLLDQDGKSTVKGFGQGRFVPDKLVAETGETAVTWSPAKPEFDLVVAGRKEGRAFLLDLGASQKMQESLAFQFADGSNLQPRGAYLWGLLHFARADSFSIEAADGASKSFAYDEDGASIKGTMSVRQVKSIALVEPAGPDIAVNGQKLRLPYVTGYTKIQTGPKDSLAVTLRLRGAVRVDANTAVELGESPKAGELQLSADFKQATLALGKLTLDIEEFVPTEQFTVQTPACSVALRKAKCTVEVRKNQSVLETVVAVTEGQVSIARDRETQMSVLKAGETLTVQPPPPPPPPPPAPPKK